MDILPFQTNSITKRWMEHTHTTREVVALSLITGSLSFIAGYYQRNACLAIGTCSFAAQQIMPEETKKGDQTPLTILSFMAFSAFVGLSLKESWSKSDIAPSNPWTAPLYLASFAAMNHNIIAPLLMGKHHIAKIDETTDLKLFYLIGLTASGVSTFLIPRLIHFWTYGAFCFALSGFLQKDKSLLESSTYFPELVKRSLCLYLGTLIGLGIRSKLGPKNASPDIPLMVKILLYTLTTITLNLPVCFFTWVYFLKDFEDKDPVKDFRAKCNSLKHSDASSLQKLKDHMNTLHPTDFKDQFWNQFFPIIILIYMEFKELSYQQVSQEFKDLAIEQG